MGLRRSPLSPGDLVSRLGTNGMPALLYLPKVVDVGSEVIRPTQPPWPVLRLLASVLRPFAPLLRVSQQRR